MRPWLLLVAALAAVSSATVVELSEANIGTVLQADSKDRPYLIKFFAPWCGHCQQLEPKFAAVAKDAAMRQRSRFGSVNCDDHKSLCQLFGVDGYPVLLLVPPGKGSVEAALVASRKMSGPRTVEGIKDFIMRMTRPPVTQLNCLDKDIGAGDGSAVFCGKGSESGSGKKGAWDLQSWVRGNGRDGVAFLHIAPSTAEATATAVSGSLSSVAAKLQDSLAFMSVPLEHLTRGGASPADRPCSKSLLAGLRPLIDALLAPPAQGDSTGSLSNEVAAAINAAGGVFVRIEAQLIEPGGITVDVTPSKGITVGGIHVGNATGALPGRVEIALPVAGDCPAVHAQAASNFAGLVQRAYERYQAGKKEGASAGNAAPFPVGVTPVILSSDGSSAPAPNTGIPQAACTTDDVTALATLTGSGAAQSFRQWVDRMRYRSLTPITFENFPAIANNLQQAYVAIAIIHSGELSEPDEDSELLPSPSLRSLSTASALAYRHSTSLPASIRERFVFGWIDATTYDAFVQQFNISPADAPQLLIVDTPSKRYWHDPRVGTEPEDWETYLADVARGIAPVQRQGILAYPQKLINAIGLLPAVAIGVGIMGLVVWCVWKLVFAELCSAVGEEEQGERMGAKGAKTQAGGTTTGNAARKVQANSSNSVTSKGKAATAPSASTKATTTAAPAASAARAEPQAVLSSTSDLDADDDGDVFQPVEEETFDSGDETAAQAADARSRQQGFTRSFRLSKEDKGHGESDDEGSGASGGVKASRRRDGAAASWRQRLGGSRAAAASSQPESSEDQQGSDAGALAGADAVAAQVAAALDTASTGTSTAAGGSSVRQRARGGRRAAE